MTCKKCFKTCKAAASFRSEQMFNWLTNIQTIISNWSRIISMSLVKDPIATNTQTIAIHERTRGLYTSICIQPTIIMLLVSHSNGTYCSVDSTEKQHQEADKWVGFESTLTPWFDPSSQSIRPQLLIDSVIDVLPPDLARCKKNNVKYKAKMR